MGRGIAGALFLLSFGVYLHGAYPSVSVGDSGEFITAAATLGVPHPSGFPTFPLLGHVFHALLPLGNPGFHLNLFSTVCGAAAVALSFGLLISQGVGTAPAFLASVLFLMGPAQALNSQATEVFELHLVFNVALL